MKTEDPKALATSLLCCNVKIYALVKIGAALQALMSEQLFSDASLKEYLNDVRGEIQRAESDGSNAEWLLAVVDEFRSGWASDLRRSATRKAS
jgi:hypothetical protein